MYTLLFAILALIISCNNDSVDYTDSSIVEPPNVVGMSYVMSDRSFINTYDMLLDALNENPNITVIAEVDHQQNASSLGVELNPTRVVFFWKPSVRNTYLCKSISKLVLISRNVCSFTETIMRMSF